jgi:hypothetical protein
MGLGFHANLSETLFCNSFSTNFQGTQELCVKGSQWIGERNVVGASYVTDLNQGNHVRWVIDVFELGVWLHTWCAWSYHPQCRLYVSAFMGATCFSKFTWVFTLCSLEAKHSVKGIAEMTLKLTNDLHGALQLCVTSSHTRECTHWGWTYRSAFSRICYGLTVHADLFTGFPGCFWKCYRNVGHRCLYNCFE